MKKRLLIVTALALLVGLALLWWVGRKPPLEADIAEPAIGDTTQTIVDSTGKSIVVSLGEDSLRKVRKQLQAIQKKLRSGNRNEQREAIRLARQRLFFTAYPQKELEACAQLPAIAGGLLQNRDFELEVLGHLEHGLGDGFPDSLRLRQLVANLVLAERARRLLPLDMQWIMARMHQDLQGNKSLDPRVVSRAVLAAHWLGRSAEATAWLKRLPAAHSAEMKAALKAPSTGALHPVQQLALRFRTGQRTKDSAAWKAGKALAEWQEGLDWARRMEWDPYAVLPDSVKAHQVIIEAKGESYPHPLRFYLAYEHHLNTARRLLRLPIKGLKPGEKQYWSLVIQWLDAPGSVACRQVERIPADLHAWQRSNWEAWRSTLCPKAPASAQEAFDKVRGAWRTEMRFWDVIYRRGPAWIDQVQFPPYSQDMENPVNNAIWLRYELDKLERVPNRLFEIDNHIVNELANTEIISDETDPIFLLNAVEHELSSGDYQSAEAFLCRLPMVGVEELILSIRQYINTFHMMENRGLEFKFYTWKQPNNMWINSYMARTWTSSYWEL